MHAKPLADPRSAVRPDENGLARWSCVPAGFEELRVAYDGLVTRFGPRHPLARTIAR